MRPRLTGQTSLCTKCSMIFTSTHSFDQHRTGKVGTPERRCRTEDELRDLGWEPDARGRWRKPAPAGTFDGRGDDAQV